MPNPESDTTADLFRKHVKQLEAMAIAGDETSVKSLACMAILIGDGPDGGSREDIQAEIIVLDRWRNAA